MVPFEWPAPLSAEIREAEAAKLHHGALTTVMLRAAFATDRLVGSTRKYCQVSLVAPPRNELLRRHTQHSEPKKDERHVPYNEVHKLVNEGMRLEYRKPREGG